MRKINRTRKQPQNPSDFAVKLAGKAWDVAIQRVDAHSLKCKPCNRKRFSHTYAMQMGARDEPSLQAYQMCPTAKRLYQAERNCIAEFRKVGGIL